jgi:alanine-glyoxylate transaminase/serine-glyoxylate transaminase/serine-pyruvate transaminase
VTFTDKEIEDIKVCKAPVQNCFMDLMLAMNYWADGSVSPRDYHHTGPVNVLYRLHEILFILQEDGIENS